MSIETNLRDDLMIDLRERTNSDRANLATRYETVRQGLGNLS
jgi:hypothetical protein